MSDCKCLTIFSNHDTRCKALKILYGIDLLTFIIRFIVICIDLSNKNLHQTNLSFSVVIFILEFIASCPVILSNLLNIFLHYCPTVSSPKQRLRTYLYPRTLLRVSTLTCFACKCYHEHPAGIHLTRLAILVSCFLVRFIAFILGALCATKFNPICVPYAVLSSLFLIPSLITVLIEMLHFHVLWNFQPFENSNSNEHHARGLLRFFPSNMTYDNRAKAYHLNNVGIGCQCDSASISHTILYHSSTLLPKIPLPPLIDGKVIIAYHLTSKDIARKIAKNGFPLGQHKTIHNRIYFTLNVPLTSTSGTSDEEVIICVRLCLGHVLQVTEETDFHFKKHRYRTPEPKALELLPQRQIKVKFPKQIENWIILFSIKTNVIIHPSGYQGLL